MVRASLLSSLWLYYTGLVVPLILPVVRPVVLCATPPLSLSGLNSNISVFFLTCICGSGLLTVRGFATVSGDSLYYAATRIQQEACDLTSSSYLKSLSKLN